MYQCPTCQSQNLSVTVEKWAKLTQWKEWDDDAYSTDAEGDDEWSETSLMRCDDCRHIDIADKFDIDSDDSDDEETEDDQEEEEDDEPDSTQARKRRQSMTTCTQLAMF